MGLIGNGVYYSPRSGILPGAVSAVGSCPAYRPSWSAVSFRRTFDSDFVSFPVGYYQDGIVLPMKLGGLGATFGIKGTSTVSAGIIGAGDAAGTIPGTCTVTAPITGLKDAAATLPGSCTMTVASIGRGSMSAAINIGFAPSADDIAFAVWGLANGIENGWTPRQSMRVMAAALAGKVSGSGVNAPVFRSITDTKPRITATTDADGDRLTVSLDGD